MSLKKGVEELREIIRKVELTGLEGSSLELDLTLARGLNYYTGAIFEVIVKDSGIGSICGGGRYDDLTGIFGWSGVSGVGISFGAERILDIMNDRSLFPDNTAVSTEVMFANFGEAEESYCVKLAAKLRAKGVKTEVYPASVKMGKQFSYADAKRIPAVVLIGSQEMEQGKVKVKDLESGEQTEMTSEDFVNSFDK